MSMSVKTALKKLSQAVLPVLGAALLASSVQATPTITLSFGVTDTTSGLAVPNVGGVYQVAVGEDVTLTMYATLTNPNFTRTPRTPTQTQNKALGMAGISTAFLGGTVLFFGQRSSRQTSVTVAPGKIAIAKRLSW